MHHMDNAVDTI